MILGSSRLLAILCVLAAAACGRGTDYDELGLRLEQGEIEAVERELAGDDSARARELLALAKGLREHRAVIRERLDRMRGERDGLTSPEVLLALRRLAEDEHDRVVLTWIETELSATLEWAAARAPELDGEPLPTPGKPYEEPREARVEAPEPALEEPELLAEPEESPPAPRSAGDTAAEAAAAEAAGDLVAASASWLELAERVAGEARERALARAFAAARRADFRAAVVSRVDLSPRAQVGAVCEHMASAGAPGEALAELGRLLAEGSIEERDAWSLVALARDERLPDGGYVFDDGVWRSREEIEQARVADESARLARRLESARVADRDAVHAEFRELARRGAGARAAWRDAVRARLQRAIGELSRSSSMRSLTSIVERRRALDTARSHALELVLDEERFFYPYTVPQVESKRAIQYPKVRTEVMERIAAVRKIWDEEERVTLARSAGEALEEVAWCRENAAEVELEPGAFSGADEWKLAQDHGLESIGIRDLALGFADADVHARDREVLARNERLWAESDATSPSELEREQVRVTNQYRRMMGHRVLAWNSRLQEAARRHSEYMDRTGDFGHDEAVPEHATTSARLRAAGYEMGLSENCFEGFFGPAAVHASWLASSEHHRNLLDGDATEMASGYAGNYWTQLFGANRDFEQYLEHRSD